MRVPDFSPSLSYTRQGSGPNAIQPPTTLFGLTTSLPLLYRYAGESAKAEADLHAQEIGRQKIEAQVRADVDAAFAAYESAHARVDRMQSRLLPQAARARDLVKLQYERGAASLFEFLDAQRTYLATQNEFLQNLSDDWTAVFQMEQASGMELHQ
jgi:cobalt-zinc-cadmium efflux system outer membrane protein